MTDLTCGDIVKITPITSEDISNLDTLFRTPSTYMYGTGLHLYPDRSKEYILCGGDCVNGFKLCMQNDWDVPIGFGLFFEDNMPFICITQVGFDLKPILLSKIGHTTEYPKRNHFIGSQVLICETFEGVHIEK